ncbi:MAG TPA: sigma-70 family RNA polymerase sigma factor [Patescibacteria group bacterium]|nr:sigma-70 family RNA polymerase sigma factor [Patescibacteria group bacterium]
MRKNTHFASVYKKLALPLTKFVIKRVSGDSQATEEVLSATMIAAWRGWNSFRHKSSYFTWLCRISLNKIADYYHDQVHRNSRIVVPLIDAFNNVDSKSLSPVETLALNELRASVNDCLNLLSPEKRKLLQFRYWYDLPYNEIAKILGISERAVEGKLYRAKHEFAKIWTSK